MRTVFIKYLVVFLALSAFLLLTALAPTAQAKEGQGKARIITITYVKWDYSPISNAMLFVGPENDQRYYDVPPAHVWTTNAKGRVTIFSILAGITAPGTYWVWQAWYDSNGWLSSELIDEIVVGPSLSGDYVVQVFF